MAKRRSIRDTLKGATRELEGAGVPDAPVEAERMLRHITGLKRHELYMERGHRLEAEDVALLEDLLWRRKKREPLAYITGEVEFRGIHLTVTKDVLIPRPETELLVERALNFLEGLEKPVIMDLCTGSGCIAVSLAVELLRKGVTTLIYATDISEAALEVARVNARANNATECVRFVRGDLFSPLEGLRLKDRADLIISNPPYVAAKERETLQPEVRDYEPPAALYAGEDGLDFIKRIIGGAGEYLRPGGLLLMEIGFSQARAVKGLASEKTGLRGVSIKKDLSGMDRIFEAVKKPAR